MVICKTVSFVSGSIKNNKIRKSLEKFGLLFIRHSFCNTPRLPIKKKEKFDKDDPYVDLRSE